MFAVSEGVKDLWYESRLYKSLSFGFLDLWFISEDGKIYLGIFLREKKEMVNMFVTNFFNVVSRRDRLWWKISRHFALGFESHDIELFRLPYWNINQACYASLPMNFLFYLLKMVGNLVLSLRKLIKRIMPSY